MDGLDALRELGAAQHGAVSRRQAAALGIDRGRLQRMLRRGELQRSTDRVVVFAGSTPSDHRALSIVALHYAPAFISGCSALAAWGLPGFTMEPIEVLLSRPDRTSAVPAAVVHTTTDLDDGHTAVLRGIPIVTPIRAIFDLAGRIHPKRVERALDNAWSRRLVSYAMLHRTLDQLGKRGRPGTVLMRELAAARPRSYLPPESNTESRLNELLQRSGLSALRRQVDAGSEDRWLGRFDLVDEELPLVVEVQSDLFHGSLLDQQRDRARRDAMTDAGWAFVEVWEHEIWRAPDTAVARIVAAREAIRPNLSRDRAS